MKRIFTMLGATALVASVATLGLGGLAEAGAPPPRLQVDIIVNAAGAEEIRDALTPELYSAAAGNAPVDLNAACGVPTKSESGPFQAQSLRDCTLGNGSYILGLNGPIPPGVALTYSCLVDSVVPLQGEMLAGPDSEFTIGDGQFVTCTIRLRAGIVAVDKVVQGGPADSKDFTLNVLDGPDTVASGADPSNQTCTSALTECALINIDTSNNQFQYVLGETPAWGYVPNGISCASNINLETYFNPGLAADTDAVAIPGSFNINDGQAYCTVANRYATGTLDVETVVINDSGGTATADDVSFEVFRSNGTPQIAATACLANGSCYDGPLAIGDYVMGYVGPAGYTVDITQNIIPPVILTEKITDDPDAVFTMEEGARVEIVITINDPVPATTTTTTTTVAPTTTVRATTTTVLDASGVTLPGTGTSSQANGWMATLALLFVASGGALLIARRRVN